jgi:hypothetical protein
MSNKTITAMVLRIPAVKYKPEYYLVNSNNTREMLIERLKKDKNIINFFISN